MGTRFRAIVMAFAGLLLWCPLPVVAQWWIPLPNAPFGAPRHDDVFFVNPDLGWVVNGAGKIYRTPDGGTSWELQATLPHYLRSVGFADSLRGWVGTLDPQQLLYSTTNGGVDWVPVTGIPEPQPTGICGIWVVNESVVYGSGRYNGPARIIKTTDGGSTWTSTSLSANRMIDCYFVDEQNGFVVGSVGSLSNGWGVVLATTDGGETWETRHTTANQGEWCWKVSFTTPTTGYVSIERTEGPSYFLQTTDGGLTWEERFFQNDFRVQGIGFATPERGWIGGWGGPTFETTDGGASWHPASFSGYYINRFRFLSPTLGYAVGYQVYKYDLHPTDVAAPAPESAAGILVVDNPPNPFRGSTTITYTLLRPSDVDVTIHDTRGREIRHARAERRPAGPHEWTWDGRDDTGHPVSAGVYLLRLDAPPSVQVKKLLVLQ